MSQQTNGAQMKVLVEFMEHHSDLAKNGLQNSSNGRDKKKKLWSRLTEALNSNGPPMKSMKGWQKVWTDYKYNAKRKLTSRMSSLTRTGGGPYDAVQLSNFEERVVAAAKINAQVMGIPDVASYGAETDIPCSSAAGPEHYAVEYLVLSSESKSSSDEEIEAPSESSARAKRSCETASEARSSKTPNAKRRCVSESEALQAPKAKMRYDDPKIPIIEQEIENQNKFQTEVLKILKEKNEIEQKKLKQKNEIEQKKLQLLEKQIEFDIQYKKVLQLNLEKLTSEIALLKRAKQ